MFFCVFRNIGETTGKTNTMKTKLLFLLFLFVLIPGISSAAESRSLDIEFAFSDPGNPASQLIGYRLYKEDLQVCETDDPGATRIACDLFTEDGTFDFTLTAFYADGSESPPSPPFPFIIESTTAPPPDPDPLQAIISTTKTNGEVPLNIIFSGADSKGEISTYSWVFGDGTTAAGSEVTHNFTTQGTYTISLTVSNQQETSPPTTTTIVAQPNTSNQEPPIAVLSSSASTGNAPLTVIFDGGSSTTLNSSIIGYHWTFGDSSLATGETVSHTYVKAGTYYTELTVEDSEGLISKADTPIIVTETIVSNEKPTAVISADQTQSDTPLTVSFDGSQSSDPDGSIVKFHWNFGDGTTGNSQAVKHTYTESAVYAVSLEVTDDQGDTATDSKEVVFEAKLSEIDLNFEVGKVTIDHEWVKVMFENNFIDPVVIAGPPTFNGEDPVLIRISNIDQTGFKIRLQEWDYLDDSHTEETFSYIVMEKGVYTIPSGVKIEAGSFTGSTRFQKTSLQQSYDSTPVILTQVVTENEADAVTGRIQKSGLSSFEYKLQEMEKTKNAHTAETIDYIAWEPGMGDLSGLLYEAGLTSEVVDHNGFDLEFQTTFPDLPLFIANMQTYEGRDTAALRTQDMTKTAIEIKTEEEQSKDAETDHAKEVVGYLIIGSATK